MKSRGNIFAFVIVAAIVGGISAQASGVLNSPSGGYLVCINSKTKVVTHPGTTKCPKGNDRLVLGAQGAAGPQGLIGATGLNGKDGSDGKDGKTLWNGVRDPESTWGAPGDMFINSVTKTLFGPKDLITGWPAGVSMIGPKGEQGAIGLTGATGPQGPGGSGPAGATGPQGPSYKVVSSDNVDVGVLIGSSGNLTVLSNGTILQYGFEGALVQTASDLIYLSNDCSGPIYTSSGQGYSRQNPVISTRPSQYNPTGNYLVRYPSSSTPILHTGYSYYDGPCKAEVGVASVVLLDQVLTGITVTYQGPLRIVLN